jgi:SAM-dependent methyltransferase
MNLSYPKRQSFAAGALGRFAEPLLRGDLEALSLVDLATEMLARLNADQRFNGSDELLLAERLKQTLEQAIDVHLNRFARRRYMDLLSPILARVKRNSLRGATIVDLGCGSVNPYTFSFLLLMLGAERAYAIDLEPIQDVPIATRALSTAAGWLLTDPAQVLGGETISPADVLANLHGFQLPLLEAGNPDGIASNRLLHRIESISGSSLAPGEADFVFSVSLIEHLESVDDALASLRQVTKVGGRGIHVIDFIDHRIYSGEIARPLEFLKDTSLRPLVHGCNRLRCDEVCAAFERHGFAIEHIERWNRHPPPTDEEHAQFAPRYRSMSREALATTGARIFVRRT